MEVTMGDNTYDYELRIAKPGNRLEGVMVSPRSGEHRCKEVRFDNGEVVMEVDREIQGTKGTFVYQGKLSDSALSGPFSVKGHEDELSGTWKASKR